MDRLYIAYGLVDEYCRNLKMRGRTERTVTEYRYRLRMCLKALKEAGLETHPAKIKEEEIDYIRTVLLEDRSIKYKHHTISIMSRWLVRMADNNIVRDMDFLWPHSERRVTWLTPEQMLYIKDVTTGVDHVCVHLAGDLGLRCSEIANLKLSDIEYPWIYVLGKGHMEGKLAPVYCHEETKPIIKEWMVTRSAIIAEHMREHPELPVPKNLLIHNHPDHIARAYSPKTLGNRMRKLSIELGIKFSMHTFRRSYCTILIDSDIPIDVVQTAMRHENIETTSLYIQRNPTKLANAREKQQKFQEEIRCKMQQ